MASSTPTGMDPGSLSISVTFGGGELNPIQTMARFVLGIHELAEQIGQSQASQSHGSTDSAFSLEVTAVNARNWGSGAAGAAGDAPRLAIVDLYANTPPGIGHHGLRHLITRLAEQIAAEDGIGARVDTITDQPVAE